MLTEVFKPEALAGGSFSLPFYVPALIVIGLGLISFSILSRRAGKIPFNTKNGNSIVLGLGALIAIIGIAVGVIAATNYNSNVTEDAPTAESVAIALASEFMLIGTDLPALAAWVSEGSEGEYIFDSKIITADNGPQIGDGVIKVGKNGVYEYEVQQR